jgi:hypothetical protein
MKVVFLFMSQSSAGYGMTPDNWWPPKHKCHDTYMDNFYREGYFILLEKLVDRGVITDLKIFFESNIGHGIASWVNHPNAKCYVVPEYKFADLEIDEDTIIWVRGGFKHWAEWLKSYKGRNWLLLYAANTGRQRWPWWDVILDDISMENKVDALGRYSFPFIKPIDTDFYSPYSCDVNIDVCIGASHIHDRKGQWRGVKVIEEYYKKYGTWLVSVMPGSPRRSLNTTNMFKDIEKKGIIILRPGHVHKKELKSIFNRSEVFIHLGAHGQNDRGPLEAAACGCNIILGSPQYHSKLLVDNSTVVEDIDDYEGIADLLHSMLNNKQIDKFKRAECFNQYHQIDISVDRMQKLFIFLDKNNPKKTSTHDIAAAMEEI